MRSITIVLILPSLAGGGAEKVILSFIENIDRNKYNIILILQNKIGPLKANLSSQNIINLNKKHFRFAFPKLIKEIKKVKPDIIFSTFPHITLSLLVVKSLFFTKSIFIAREPNMIDFSLKHSSFLLFIKYFYGVFIHKADKIIVTSNAMQNNLVEKGIDKKKLFLIHNPVNKVKIRDVKNYIRYPGKGLRLVFAGRLVYQKGIDRILPIIKNIQDCHLTIIGNGSMKPLLEKMIIDLNIINKINFINYSNNINEYIASADYLILPSRWEGLPNIVLESLILGTPVISFSEITGLNDIKLLVDKTDLFLCKNEEEIQNLLSNLEPRKDINNISLRNILLKKFNSPKDYSKKIMKLMEELIIEKRN